MFSPHHTCWAASACRAKAVVAALGQLLLPGCWFLPQQSTNFQSPPPPPLPPQVLGGKHMVPEAAVTVMGQPPFHSHSLTSSGALSYVGGNWERDIAFAGYAIPLAVRCSACSARSSAGLCCSMVVDTRHELACMHGSRCRRCWGAQLRLAFPLTQHTMPAVPPPSPLLQGDIPASQMLESIPGVDPARRERLMDVSTPACAANGHNTAGRGGGWTCTAWPPCCRLHLPASTLDASRPAAALPVLVPPLACCPCRRLPSCHSRTSRPAAPRLAPQVLDIDPTWRMHLVSDGQRRRVQIAMGLLKPFQVCGGGWVGGTGHVDEGWGG